MKKFLLEESKGQSTLEYLIVLAVLIAAIISVAVAVLNPAIRDSMTRLGDAIRNAADQF
ncbi:MAG: hypothetical protein AB1629_04930 [Candidatus Omnitrophota bacterium]